MPNNRRVCRSRYSDVAVALRCSTNQSEILQVHYCRTGAYSNVMMLCPPLVPNRPFLRHTTQPSRLYIYLCSITCLLPLLRPSDVYTRTSSTSLSPSTSSTSFCGCCLPCFCPNAFHAVSFVGAAPIDISYNLLACILYLYSWNKTGAQPANTTSS